jgi:fatty-acyl-CoA synthase
MGRWKLPRGMKLAGRRRGGAGILIRAFDRHGIWILQGWGMTETSPVCTISYPRPNCAMSARTNATAAPPWPACRCRWWTCACAAITARPALGRQSVGEIQVRGPFITGSYHEVAVEADKFTPTAGCAPATWPAWTTWVCAISDRTKDLIKSGGEWISSVDLENALMAHPAVAEAAVIAIPDEKWSERPLACVVLKPGQRPSPDESFNSHCCCRHHFAKWQLPDRYEFIEAVPRTSTGKFWKLKLRERFPA